MIKNNAKAINEKTCAFQNFRMQACTRGIKPKKERRREERHHGLTLGAATSDKKDATLGAATPTTAMKK